MGIKNKIPVAKTTGIGKCFKILADYSATTSNVTVTLWLEPKPTSAV